MTTARSTRRQAVLAARADVTVRGPILARLACSCVVDDAGGVWSPCEAIAADHAAAMAIVRQGPQLAPAMLPRDNNGRIIPDPLAALQATIAAHVAAGEREAHGMTRQAVML